MNNYYQTKQRAQYYTIHSKRCSEKMRTEAQARLHFLFIEQKQLSF